MDSVFVKRYPSKGELPKSDGKYWCKFKDFSDELHQQEWVLQFGGFGDNKCYEYWLEEIELPNEDEVINNSSNILSSTNEYEIGFESGANFILNKLA